MLLVATVRGEAPLVEALQIASQGARGKKRRILQQLLTDLESGSSLSQALKHQSQYFPESYQAAIRAGEESGFLQSSLEGMARHLDKLLELRRTLGVALLYPVLVLLSAYLIFLVVGHFTMDAFRLHFRDFDAPVPIIVEYVYKLSSNTAQWAWFPPALLLLAWWSWIRGNSWDGISGKSPGILSFIPGLRGIIRTHQLANFTEVTGVLLDSGVPYHQALRTAALASGELQLLPLLQPSSETIQPTRKLPPLIRWLLGQATESGNVRETIRGAAEMYRRRAELGTTIIKSTAPILFLVLIAGSTTLIYALAVFYPFIDILNNLQSLR